MRRKLPHPSLLVRFSLISLLPIVGLGLVLGRDVQQRARSEAIHDARTLSVDVANLRIAPSLARSDINGKPLPPARARALERVLRSALASSDVARAKLWAPNGRVVFSDDHGITGKKFEVEEDLEEALGGEVHSGLTDLKSAESARDRGLGEAVEVYVPLRFGNNPKPAGAFELYVPYKSVAARVQRDARHQFMLLLAGLGVLWLLLFRIVAGASSRLRRQARENHHQATHDALTGLPNRAAFSRRVDAVADEGRGAVALIDLDRFKEINDTLGHEAGDALLREVGPRLAAALDESVMVARLGGDEFALLLPGGHPDAAARKALAELEVPFEVEGLQVHVEGSLGLARFPEHGREAGELLRRADIAMYEAKRLRSRVSEYDASADTADADRLMLLGELRGAIDRDELVLHFQPKYDLRTRRLLGVEALVRWQHPDRGLLPPAAFVPMAEHTGLIRPLTLWVLDRAMRQCKEWRDSGHELTMAVNLSVANLLDASLPGDVAALLGELRLPPSALELEITESVVMTDPVRAHQVLDLLRSMGIRLAIDDFGTGHASLAYLQRLPVSELKIDRAFIGAMTDSAGDEAIVRSTIDLAHNLGLEVVAEGVEDEAVTERLRVLGCDTAQGFHLGRPVPAPDVVLEAPTEPGAPAPAADGELVLASR